MPDTTTIESLEALRLEALRELESASGEALEVWRSKYLGRKGRLTQVLRGIVGMPPDERRSFGAAANTLKEVLENAFADRAAAVGPKPADTGLDVTLPGRRPLQGRLHPVTQTVRDIAEALTAMGFQIVEGPEVEHDYYNFTALNIPPDHPARDMWDTLWVDRVDAEGNPRILLRTHTSPMQARVMEKTKPPVRVAVPGRCYRYEATDATHEWHFHQVEGLAVAEGITFAELKGTLYEFARRIFGPERKVRFRCDYFPFVEPGVDMAIDWKGEWLEIMGAGMVHPRVLAGVGYDPEKFTGFAFGMGVERIALLRHGIDDIRHFAANDLRFLSQF
ncbi:MAG: phenylalanine--tRNA ligase subunit alpha [Chloroflexi bacterium]|nr:phenylalanine--tRNA ligase subunit alpha [Chloroflexota bacterium]